MTRDIIDSFFNRRDTLVCFVWESQAIGYWLRNISNLGTFADNKRILHEEGLIKYEEVLNRNEICQSFLAIHKSYPERMRLLWSVYVKEQKTLTYRVPLVSYRCEHQPAMNYKVWTGNKLWFSEPKLCKDNPVWNRDGEYKGRRGY